MPTYDELKKKLQGHLSRVKDKMSCGDLTMNGYTQLLFEIKRTEGHLLWLITTHES